MENTLDACDSKASVAVTTRNAGKSSHVAALRSLGLLHDLQVSCNKHEVLNCTRIIYQAEDGVQEYVTTLQQTAAEQEKELSKLRGEKEDAERVNALYGHSYCIYGRQQYGGEQQVLLCIPATSSGNASSRSSYVALHASPRTQRAALPTSVGVEEGVAVTGEAAVCTALSEIGRAHV